MLLSNSDSYVDSEIVSRIDLAMAIVLLEGASQGVVLWPVELGEMNGGCGAYAMR